SAYLKRKAPSDSLCFCVPPDNLLCQMDQRDTWDRFYAAKGDGAAGPRHFEWFFGYREIAGLLLTHLQGLPPGPARVLDVGCGTSGLGLGLLRDCPRRLRVSCLDFSPPAVATLRRLLRESPPPRHPLSRLRCHVADATRLAGAFPPRSFHLVLDKGTCDALLRGPRGPGRAGGLVAACLALLRPEGRLLQFSDEDPDARAPFLERAGGVPVAVQEVGCFGGIRYYAYILGPRQGCDETEEQQRQMHHHA
uniref:Citrate synthase-lysine N-methyltransferase CSKMT, mitochondrial n=1 Tax=Varanus komodoensis TaxID=61221 RepID=A0A8D2KR78_VARKO